MPRRVPTKLEEIRFPIRGLNFGREGTLDLSQWDGVNRLPVSALPAGLHILLGGYIVRALNYQDLDESIANGANEDVIEDTDLNSYFLRGFLVNGTGDGIVTLYATRAGRGAVATAGAGLPLTMIAQKTIDIDHPTIELIFPNPVRVANTGTIRLNIENTSGATAVYSSTIYGFSYSGTDL